MARKKSVLITGGMGFVGRNLTEQLSAHYDVLAPSRRELDLMDAPAVKAYIRQAQPDALVHAANVGGKRGQAVDDVAGRNLRMFFNVARCEGEFGRLLQMGSGAEYGKTDLPPKVKEERFDAQVPDDDYGFYKYVCAKSVARMEDAVGLRVFGCYGRYEDFRVRFISDNLLRAIAGRPVGIDNQNVKFDYLYVDDLVRVVRHFISKKPKQRFYNVTPDRAVDLLTIAKLIQSVAGRTGPVSVGKPGMGPEYSGSNARLRKEIPGLALTPLRTGIERLHEYYKQNPPA